MIVRYELDTGRHACATVPARQADQLGNLDIFAWNLLEAVPGAACIQVWANGRSVLDAPDAEARPPQPEGTPPPSRLVLDVATAIMLTEADQTALLTGAPPWLTRGRCSPRPTVLRGRPTNRHVPRV